MKWQSYGQLFGLHVQISNSWSKLRYCEQAFFFFSNFCGFKSLAFFSFFLKQLFMDVHWNYQKFPITLKKIHGHSAKMHPKREASLGSLIMHDLWGSLFTSVMVNGINSENVSSTSDLNQILEARNYNNWFYDIS
jgi:hypothetical protein